MACFPGWASGQDLPGGDPGNPHQYACSEGNLPHAESLAAPIRRFPLRCIAPDGLGETIVGQLWDTVYLSPRERDVITALHLISPGVERVGLKGARDGTNP